MTTMKTILSRLTQAVSGTDKELFSEQELDRFASFHLDKWNENASGDVVAEAFVVGCSKLASKTRPKSADYS